MKTYVITEKQIRDINVTLLGTAQGLRVKSILKDLKELGDTTKYPPTGGPVLKPTVTTRIGEQANDYGDMYGMFGDDKPIPAPSKEPMSVEKGLDNLAERLKQEEYELQVLKAREAMNRVQTKHDIILGKRADFVVVDELEEILPSKGKSLFQEHMERMEENKRNLFSGNTTTTTQVTIKVEDDLLEKTRDPLSRKVVNQIAERLKNLKDSNTR